MCGIAGVFAFEQREIVREDSIQKMCNTMAHRGPDGEGTWFNSDRSVGLGHRRLSIIDLSNYAAQPMCNENADVWLVFNGEIYNHYELRPELEKAGHIFKTNHSDTEVIIHAYEEWGIDCIQRFRGMFAFALWDERQRCLYLVRDRIGVKPLYYTIQNGKVIFASEIKAILTDPTIPRAVSETAFFHYLSFLTSPAPDTLFDGIKKLPSASYLKISQGGNIQLEQYWDVLNYTSLLTHHSETQIKEQLLDELRTAVKYRKISDVPVGVFLSGGIDSSANAALFAENEVMQLKTFTIGYDGNHSHYQNEFEFAQLMANSIHAEYHEKRLKVDDFIEFLPSLIYHQDEPIADNVCVPTYYLSKLARDNGVTVCQVGEGADELFWGYPGWKRMLRLSQMNNLPIPRSFKRLGLLGLRAFGRQDTSYYEWLRRAARGQPVFWGGAEGYTETEKYQLLSPRLKQKFAHYSSYEALQPIFQQFQKNAEDQSPLNWMSYLDLKLRLPELLLMRVDKMTMAASLEARVPFLDHKFVEFAMSIPQAIKTKNGDLKYILKQAVRGIIPNTLIDRKKQGFAAPIYEWFFDKLGHYTREKLLNFVKRTDFFDENYITQLLDQKQSYRQSYRLWYCLNFVLWYEHWFESGR